MPLSRCWLHIRALHPEFAGVSRVWRRGMPTDERFLDFGFEKWPAYLNSPVRYVVEHRKHCRWRLDDGEPLPFPVLEEHRSAGYVDYDRNLLMSEDFARNLDSPMFEIGYFRLRGFSRMQLLFGLPTA